MNKLLEEIEKNPELKAKIEELNKNPGSTAQDYIRTAAECGVELKEEDFSPAGGQEELGDDELDAVAGGDECFCLAGGGGTANSKNEGTCACVLGGGGEYAGSARDQEGAPRCVCIFGGTGRAHS